MIDKEILLKDFEETKAKVIKLNTLLEISERDLKEMTEKLKTEFGLTEITPEILDAEKAIRELEIEELLEKGTTLLQEVKNLLSDFEGAK